MMSVKHEELFTLSEKNYKNRGLIFYAQDIPEFILNQEAQLSQRNRATLCVM